MTIFWISVAVLSALALLFVALPLLKRDPAPGVAGSDAELNLCVYRDQLAELEEDLRSGRLSEDKYAQARSELESRLLEEMPRAAAPVARPAQRRSGLTAFAASVAVPLLAVFVYLAIGNPGALRAQASESPHGLGQQQMEAMIARLAERLEKDPQDPKGWAMLARAQTVMGRYGEASAAYAKSVEMFPENAQLLADYADALAMAQGGRLQGEPEKLVERALRADPNNAKALALAGTVAYGKQDFALAVQRWERLRSLIPPGSEFAKSVQGSIEEAKSMSIAGGGASAGLRTTAGR